TIFGCGILWLHTLTVIPYYPGRRLNRLSSAPRLNYLIHADHEAVPRKAVAPWRFAGEVGVVRLGFQILMEDGARAELGAQPLLHACRHTGNMVQGARGERQVIVE